MLILTSRSFVILIVVVIIRVELVVVSIVVVVTTLLLSIVRVPRIVLGLVLSAGNHPRRGGATFIGPP